MGLLTDGQPPGGGDDRILFWPQVKGIARLSRTTVWRMQRSGDFPAAVQVSRGRVGWWESELTAWKLARTPRHLPDARAFAQPPAAALVARRRAEPLSPLAPASGSTPTSKPKPTTVSADHARVLPEKAEPAAPTSRRRPRRTTPSPDQIAFDFGS